MNLFNLAYGNNTFEISATDKAGNIAKKIITLYYTDTNQKTIKEIFEEPQEVTAVLTEGSKEKDSQISDVISENIIEISYIIKKNDTFRKLGNRFYGVAEMGELIAKYNNILVYMEYRDLKPGKEIKIPIYRDFTFGKLNKEIELKRNISKR